MKQILFLFLAFLALNLSANELKQDPNIASGKLENGLKYYIKENKLPPNSAYFYLTVSIGSIDERENELGIAHFVEHMAFNGSRGFSKNELVKKLESLGVSFGADLNAQTSYDQTGYILEIQATQQNLKDIFKVYRGWIDGISFEATELEKERGIIIEEERSRNTPFYRFFMKNRAPEFYTDSIYLNRAPIGDMNIIKNVDVKTMKGFYQRTYQPRFMSFIAVGDFDKKQIEKLVIESFSSAKNTNDYKSPDKTIPLKNGFRVNNYDSKEIGLNAVELAFWQKYKFANYKERLRHELVLSYISNLFALIYEQRDLVLRGSFSAPVIEDQNVLYNFQINAPNDDFDAALGDLAGILKGVSEFGFNKNDFESVKKNFINSAKNKFLQAGNQPSRLVAEDMEETIRTGGVVLSAQDEKDVNLKLLDEITLDEINAEFARILGIKSKALNIISTKGVKLNETKFDEIWASAKPYNTAKSETSGKELVDESKLAPKKILSKAYDKKLDLYTYKLENNATVVIKDIKTKKDVVSLLAVSAGGTSNLKEPKLGGFAVSVSNDSGAGEFSNYALAQLLSGKQIEYQKNINQLTQSYKGSASSADIEWLLKAIYLEFSAPRLDEKVLAKLKISELERLEKTKNLPQKKFNDEFVRFRYDDNPRTNPLEPKDIESLELGALKKIIDDKFTNAADFKFIIVGDVNLTALEPLLQKYIANLPSRADTQSFVDDGVRSLDGRHKFVKSYQTTKRSDVSMSLKNDGAKYSKIDAMRAQALSAVMDAMLREEVREERGQVYRLGVSVRLSKQPYERVSAHFGFTTEPNSVEAVLAEISATINKVKNGEGDIDRHLQNYKKSAMIKMRQAYVQPEFWVRAVTNELVFEDKILTPNEYEAMLNSITKDDIVNAAKTYLDETNVIIGVNEPAGR